jgi:hypothetical protein
LILAVKKFPGKTFEMLSALRPEAREAIRLRRKIKKIRNYFQNFSGKFSVRKRFEKIWRHGPEKILKPCRTV